MLSQQNQLITQLQRAILPLGGIPSSSTGNDVNLGMPSLEEAFPNASFPTGCTHEFVYSSWQGLAATSGFVSGVLGKLLLMGGVCLYISTSRTLFPPSLKRYGIEPHQIIFIDVKKESDVLYATEEALKCGRVTAVIIELDNISFTQSRRFQLAAEKGRTTGFFLRKQSLAVTTTASVSKWSITPIASGFADDLPGVGHPRWNVELLKVRNGQPGKWQIEWTSKGFTEVRGRVHVVMQENKSKMRV